MRTLGHKFSELKDAFENLRFSDPDILRIAGLGRMAKVYEAYPLKVGTSDLCFLFPVGMNPKDAYKLDESSAAQRIIVLEKSVKGWVKAWPTPPSSASQLEKPAGAATEPAAENSKNDWEDI
jgi:hypothetical protein